MRSRERERGRGVRSGVPPLRASYLYLEEP